MKKYEVVLKLEIDSASLGAGTPEDVAEAIEIALRNGMLSFLHWKFEMLIKARRIK